MRFDLALTLPFIVFFVFQLVHHQLWRDELNAFALAAASPTFGKLLFYVHHEGHPWLWYAMLWVLTRFTVDPVGMKVLEGLIGTALYLVIGLKSPFTRVQKLLLFACYFVSFEYTVMSRMYSVMFLLALLYVRRRSLHPERVIGNGVLLGLLASSDLTGMVLSGGLLLEFAWSVTLKGSETPEGALRRRENRRRVVTGGAVYAGFFLLAVLSLWPAKDISTRTRDPLLAHATSLKHLAKATMNTVVGPYFPTATGLRNRFWNADALGRRDLFEVALPLVLAAYWWTFRKHGNLLLLLGTVVFFMVCMSDLVYMGSMRHFGTCFVAFLAGIWIMRASGEKLAWTAYVLLGLTALAGIDAAYEQRLRPFSNARATALWLQQNHLASEPWVGTTDTSVIGVAESVHRPLYMLECNCSDTFVLYSKRRDSYDASEIPERMALAEQKLGVHQFVFIGKAPIVPEEEQQLEARGLHTQLLKAFLGAEVWEEDFYVYAVTDRPPA
jgi:hypothetical protein